jgi:GT2 family glycosyltransferase
VVPNLNGTKWFEALFRSIEAQSVRPLEVIVVDNGSSDGSADYITGRWPEIRVIKFSSNRGFAAAANAGVEAATGEFTALVNTDIELAADWLERCERELDASPKAGSIATKMVSLEDPSLLYDAGDFLRRDGATEQRGRFRTDTGRFDTPEDAWSACAGAALYRTAAVRSVGGFNERLFIYLEDIELGLRLRLNGWSCRYVPCVAKHAGGGSESELSDGATYWVERNTIAIVARYFPARWLGMVCYRQLAWALHHSRSGTLRAWLRGLAAGLGMVPSLLRERGNQRLRLSEIERAIPKRPWRGPDAGGHRDSPE